MKKKNHQIIIHFTYADILPVKCTFVSVSRSFDTSTTLTFECSDIKTKAGYVLCRFTIDEFELPMVYFFP